MKNFIFSAMSQMYVSQRVELTKPLPNLNYSLAIAEVYKWPCRTSTRALCEDIKRILDVNYSRKKAP